MRTGTPAGPMGAGSGQGRGRSSHMDQALLLARQSLSWTVCVCDLTTTLYEWEWSLHPPRRTARLRESKSLTSILAILGRCCAPGRPVWPQWQKADQSWEVEGKVFP